MKIKDMSNKVRDRLPISKVRELMRAEILQFCDQPRTHTDVANAFNISGTSAAAYLSFHRLRKRLKYNQKTHQFVAVGSRVRGFDR